MRTVYGLTLFVSVYYVPTAILSSSEWKDALFYFGEHHSLSNLLVLAGERPACISHPNDFPGSVCDLQHVSLASPASSALADGPRRLRNQNGREEGLDIDHGPDKLATVRKWETSGYGGALGFFLQEGWMPLKTWPQVQMYVSAHCVQKQRPTNRWNLQMQLRYRLWKGWTESHVGRERM